MVVSWPCVVVLSPPIFYITVNYPYICSGLNNRTQLRDNHFVKASARFLCKYKKITSAYVFAGTI